MPDILHSAMSTVAPLWASAHDAKINAYVTIRVELVIDILRYHLQKLTFIYVEWMDARTGLSDANAMAVMFDRNDDAPLMQKYQTQPDVCLKLPP